ncbi:tektin [Holotrichia oblita]|uniref:Tektin n=3 Tax=Holotrichia oblita TaxID=644536 RepID=A0ACB9TX56_HOLOL|nr:tektin [Holotrichia oblita]KAI4471378.1 tektin [Holotrichia oblita]
MQNSVVTLEKPIPHIGLADWYAKQWENQQMNDTRRNDAFNLRHQARQLRNETKIRMDWDTYHNNARLADRITEVGRWRDTLQACLDRVNREMNNLREEKFSTEKELDALSIPIGVVSECISIRDCRQGAELTYDEGDTELKKELCVLESVKKLLIDRCQASWEKLNRLEEVRFKLTLDINDKGETIEIDQEQLKLDRNCANISYKTDSLRIPSTSLPYETWLEHSKYTKLLADKELEDTLKLRESLFVMRERANNDMRAQRDYVDFTLRKRIYETQRARNELQWQQLKMREEMEKVEKEIDTLESALKDKDDARKLAESRLENRTYRPGIELARDEPETGLKDEVMQLRQTQRDLQDKIYCAKATYNALEDQQVIIDRELANKQHSLMTDVRCLDLRMRLRTGTFGTPATDTDRNIVLTRMENEIPPT